MPSTRNWLRLGQHSILNLNHAIELLPNGDIAVLARTQRTRNYKGTPTVYNGDEVLVLNPNLQVTWVWDPFQWLDTNRLPPDGAGASDWTHANAINFSSEDGDLLVSLRNQDWVLKIDYDNGGGDGHIVWRLGAGGDFTAISSDPYPWFSGQHDARYINDTTIVLFDDGNTRHDTTSEKDSRGQEWVLNEQTMTATLVVNADMGNYASFLGSAQTLPNGNLAFNSTPRTIEVLPNGTRVYVEAMNINEYRSYFASTLYSPSATVGASWGGQTATLQNAPDGLRLLPAGRSTDLPWFGIQNLSFSFNKSVILTPTDISVTGLVGGNYGPVTISGSGTTYMITLNKPINSADRVTITFANPTVSFNQRLDVVPGDVNDDGVVSTTDGLLILANETPDHAYQAIYDMNGDGVVNTADFDLANANNNTSDLVAEWTFDEGSGTTAGDATGHNHTGTLVGNVTWTAGEVGSSALSFNPTTGTNPHVVIADAPDLRFSNTQSFTLGAWVYVPTLPGQWSTIVAKSRDQGNWYGLWISNTNHWVAGGQANLTGGLVTTGWHYLTLVQDGTANSRLLYVDGVQAASGKAQNANGPGDLWIGGSKSFNQYFNGSIDEVRLYQRALSASEVQTLASLHNPAVPTSFSVTASVTTTTDGANAQGASISFANTVNEAQANHSLAQAAGSHGPVAIQRLVSTTGWVMTNKSARRAQRGLKSPTGIQTRGIATLSGPILDTFRSSRIAGSAN